MKHLDFNYNLVQSYYNQPEMVMAQKSLELSAIKKLCHITESVELLIEQTRQTSPYSCSKQNYITSFMEKRSISKIQKGISSQSSVDAIVYS